MKRTIPNGVWPTMVTPFTEANEIDFTSLEALIDWYIGQNVHGLFAVCQSSEMFYLSLEERVELARFVVEKTAGRVPVIASGHVSDSIDDQVEEIKQISATGIEAFVLVSNRLAAQDDSEDIWKKNAETLLERVPGVQFGIYECPYPYKRLLSPELLRWCADTGRFLFLKDTCCDTGQIQAKIEAVEGTSLKVYNANCTTLLDSLKLGAAGFSGVMANFHPDLYAWLTDHWEKEPEKASQVQSFLGAASLAELQYYPVNAKYYLQTDGVFQTIRTRSKNEHAFLPNQRLEIDQLKELTNMVRTYLFS